MSSFEIRLQELIAKCPAQALIRKAIRECVKAEGVDEIRVFDGEEWEKFKTDREGVKKAAAMTIEIDGTVTFRIGKAAFIGLNDGPYDRDTRAETIIDHNDRFGEIVGDIYE
ncbi:MAG: hypothetical protein RIA09_15880 [Hoeflea sp.]|jgi:hypothetical protein|uniref:hypothetical protein n=1 Tax=Hoeflea sp. TaxID=1940281 RepID=UPI0032EBE839